MAQRTIDLIRCLCSYPGTDCQQCAEHCPQQAVSQRQIDAAKCDNCGLCTAHCPVGAILSDTDYDSGLSSVRSLTPPVLMCQKASQQGFPCLGFLNRRILWALAGLQPLAIDTSRCQECKPAVARWLAAEIAACNEALQAAGRHLLKLVKVRPAPATPPVAVGRRSFFRSLFKAASHEAQKMAQAQKQYQYAFDPVVWLEKQHVTPCSLFPGLKISSTCSHCGLCINMCPEKALQFNSGQLIFTAQKCSGCGLCVNSCPAHALQLLPEYSGQQEIH